MSTVIDTPDTVANLIERLGVPVDRIRCQPPPGTATERDVIDWNGRGVYCELVDGVLVEKSVGQYESRLAMWLGHFLLTFLEEHDLEIVHGPDSPHRLKLGQIRYPDVAFASYERLPAGQPTREPVAPWVPDLAVEIISAGNTPREMDLKRQQYFNAGVQLVWYVYPNTRSVQVYTATDEFVSLGENDTLDGGDILPGFTLSIQKWFDKAK